MSGFSFTDAAAARGIRTSDDLAEFIDGFGWAIEPNESGELVIYTGLACGDDEQLIEVTQ